MKTSPFLVIKLWRKKKKKTFYASQKFNETPSTSAAPIQTRRSRVMHVEDKSKAFRQVVRKDQLAKLQEVRTAPEHWTQQNNIGRRRMMSPLRKNPELKSKKKTLFYEQFYHKTLGDLFRKISLLTTHSMNHNSREFTKCFSSPSHSILQITRTCALFTDGKRMKITAVHYEGDTSSLVMGRHHDFRGTEGNGRTNKAFFFSFT